MNKYLLLSVLSFQIFGMQEEQQLSTEKTIEILAQQKADEDNTNNAKVFVGAMRIFAPSMPVTSQRYLATYRNFENLIAQDPHILFYPVAGGITYNMSLNQMKTFITKKFEDLYNQGKILTPKQFQELDENQWHPQDTKLTRIWGAEYLAQKFKENQQNNLKVPEYIMVVNNLDNLKIRIYLSPGFPIIAALVNGKIYAEKIVGRPAARSVVVGHGYTDYSALDNIIYDNNTKKYYVVDTEYKSFYDGYPKDKLFENIPGNFADYVQRRFKLLNKIKNDDYDNIELNISVQKSN